MKRRLIRSIFIALLIVCFSLQAYAETDFAAIKSAIVSRQFDQITNILIESNDEDAKNIEAFALDEARSAIINDNLDDAFAITEAVLMFNLDNNDAQSLYVSIEESINTKLELEKQKQKEADERRQLEA